MNRPLRVLVVEDSEDDAQLVLREIRRGGFELDFERVETAAAMRAALESREWDLVISDYRMPQFSGEAALELFRTTASDTPFIIVSGTIGEETAVAALKAGAHDFLIKSKLARLLPAIERELREAEMRRAHKQLEKQFLLAQRMEAVGRLAGGVAHDFNNLLTVISGRSYMAREKLRPDDPARESIEEVIQAAERAATLTRQLLAFSRQQILQPCVLDLNAVVADMDKLLRRLIGEDIELATVCAKDLGQVKADRGQIEQVIMNLAVNSRDAMPRGGKLTLETANVELDESYAASHLNLSPGLYVLLAVSDTGVGMDEATKSHIFEPFFTTKEPGKGTGLGLATAYGIVKQSGGYIWAYSEPGRGATFKVYLPRVDEPVGAVRLPEAAVRTRTGNETILLVEDEAALRAMALEILRSRGYQVLEADCGQKALEVAGKHRGIIHLLLTDVVMPGMGGRELAERLSSLHPRMKVLYMSGYAGDAIVRNGVLASGSFFIQKPFSPDSLLRKVREGLDGGRNAR